MDEKPASPQPQPTPTQTTQPPQQTQTPKQPPKRNWFFWIVTILLLCSLSYGIYYLLMVVLAGDVSSPNLAIPTRVPSPTTTPVSNQIQENQEYKTRLYTEEEVQEFNTKFQTTFPEEITALTDSQLTPISCSQTIFNKTYPPSPIEYYSYNPNIPNPTANDTIPLTDETYIAYANNALQRANGEYIESMKFCKTQSGVEYAMFAIPNLAKPCGGGGCTEFYFSKIVNNNFENFLLAENFVPGAYPSCRNPLLLTTDNIMYWRCGGGDGPSGSTKIVKINFSNDTVDVIFDCFSYTDLDTRETHTRCE